MFFGNLLPIFDVTWIEMKSTYHHCTLEQHVISPQPSTNGAKSIARDPRPIWSERGKDGYAKCKHNARYGFHYEFERCDCRNYGLPISSDIGLRLICNRPVTSGRRCSVVWRAEAQIADIHNNTYFCSMRQLPLVTWKAAVMPREEGEVFLSR